MNLYTLLVQLCTTRNWSCRSLRHHPHLEICREGRDRAIAFFWGGSSNVNVWLHPAKVHNCLAWCHILYIYILSPDFWEWHEVLPPNEKHTAPKTNMSHVPLKGTISVWNTMEYIFQPLIFQGTFDSGEYQQAEINNFSSQGGWARITWRGPAPNVCWSGPLYKTTKVSQIKILKESLVIRMLVKNIHPWVAKLFVYTYYSRKLSPI